MRLWRCKVSRCPYGWLRADGLNSVLICIGCENGCISPINPKVWRTVPNAHLIQPD